MNLKSFQTPIGCGLLLLACTLAGTGCSALPETPAERNELSGDARDALSAMQREDPGLRGYLNNAYAYAIFPNVGQGAAGIGGAHGTGEVYKNGALVGYADLLLVNVGIQLGGREYSELILFRAPAAFDNFRNNNLKFAAGASAVILQSGASAEAKWEDDTAVFTYEKGGAMFSAAIGGQRFKYKPISPANPPPPDSTSNAIAPASTPEVSTPPVSTPPVSTPPVTTPPETAPPTTVLPATPPPATGPTTDIPPTTTAPPTTSGS